MLISDAFKAYAADVIVFRNQSPKTEENHYVCMRAMLAFFEDVEIHSLTFPMVRDWKLALERTRSPETVRNYVIRLRVVLGYLIERGHHVLPPSNIPVPKRGDKVPVFITKEDVSKLIKVTSKPVSGYAKENRLRNAAIISLLYASGIRVSELCSLDRNDIRDDGSFTVLGKGHRARLCFVDDRTNTLLKDYMASRSDNHPALFLSIQNGRRMSAANVQTLFRLARKKAGFSAPIHPHTMRHSFATNLLRNNANIRYVQALLGHASLETTQQYTHVVNKDLHNVYREHHTV
jgi:site-specific recombinase XerD